MKAVKWLAVAALAAQVAGCASAIDGATQTIMVNTEPTDGANCLLSNTRGKWEAVSPAKVIVTRSVTVLKVRCSKDGMEGTAYLSPRVSREAMIGMALPYVGLLATAVDSSTGAANTYPDTVRVKLLTTVAAPDAPAPAQH
ncbi:MAG TPA: hypothetical protein VHL34_17475 [Rhizomicrobium sp.]|nr:hypothetical protein [Rhizomicrobium sp.]